MRRGTRSETVEQGLGEETKNMRLSKGVKAKRKREGQQKLKWESNEVKSISDDREVSGYISINLNNFRVSSWFHNFRFLHIFIMISVIHPDIRLVFKSCIAAPFSDVFLSSKPKSQKT